MGALAVTFVDQGNAGNIKWLFADVAFSTSYSTGGDTGLTSTLLGWTHVGLCLISPVAGYTLNYVYASGNIIVYRSAGFAPAGTIAAHLHTIDGSGAAPGAYTQANTLGLSADANGASMTTGTVARTGITGIQNTIATFTGAAIAAAALVQVAATTNLSIDLAVVRCFLLGK